MTPRVVFVSEAFHPDLAGSAVTVGTVASGLAGSFPALAIVGQPDFTASGLQAPARERWQGVEIRRCRTLGLDKNGVVQRPLRAGVVATTIGATVAREVRKGDVVLVVLSPGWLPIVAVEAARRRGARVVLLAYDLFPEPLVAAGFLKPDAWIYRGACAVFHRLYGRADAVVVLGRCMAERVASIALPAAPPIHLIRHWADLDLIPPPRADQPTLRQELGLGGKFVFLFAGNLGRVQALDTVARAMALLGDSPDLHALFVGTGGGEATLRRIAAERGLTNVSFAPMRPRTEQAYVLGAADVGIVSLSEGMAGLGVPGKTPNLLAAGKPVLAIMEPHAETARLVLEEQVGWVASPSDPAALAATMRRIAADREGVDRRAARCRGVAERVFAKSTMLEAYADVIASVVSATP